MTRRLVLPVLLTLPFPVLAQSALPPESAVQQALDEHPLVQAGGARVEAAKADARVLGLGPHELTFTGSYIRRSVDREGRYDEYDATLSKAIRLPGKARLDREAGELGVKVAQNRAEDARHQAAIQLNDLWWDWLGASAEAAVDAQGVMNYEATLATVRRRVALRDAAELDADQAEATLGEARSMAAQSAGRMDLARARLGVRFPGLPIPPDAPVVGQPSLPVEGVEAMAEQVVSRSHEIGAADAEAARLASLAERARREKLADPSLGLRLFSERNGAERGAGLVFSMPIGGRARSATADRVASQAQAASAELSQVRLEVREVAASDATRARAAQAAWLRSREALDAQVAALQKLRRGHRLGAIDLGEVLQGERLTHAAFRTEALARIEAHRAINRLRIDSHNLWISE